jgi:uridine monophosphate synthetase
MFMFIEEKEVQCDQLCGVPYTALPLATLLSVKMRQPMLIRRKEAKGYGTKKLIEGKFQNQETCLIIEDVVTTGSSIIETTNDLRAEGLVVEDAIVVVDREQGGKLNLTKKGITMHSLFTLPYLMNILRDEGKIDHALAASIQEYISKPTAETPVKTSRLQMSFSKRAETAKNDAAKELFKIMETKKTNLCLAADLTKTEEILNLAESLGPFICILKTHVDIVEDFSQDFVQSLKGLAIKHNFMLMEDRKFADIGNTVALQFSRGMYKISEWCDLVTSHSLPGDGILKGLKEVIKDKKSIGVFMLAEMSSEGHLMTPEYTSKTIQMISSYSDIVAGIVAQSAHLFDDAGLIQLTPGCKLDESSDNLGQKYNTPEYLVKEKGADVAVVGRGIIESKNPVEVAKTYRDRLWTAYEQRLAM